MHDAPWGVIFDVDGTMVDNHAYHERAWITWGERNGYPIDHTYYREHIHSRSNEVITKELLNDAWRPEAAAAIEHEKERIYRELYRPVVTPLPGLIELVHALSEAGVPMAAASNAPKPNADMVLEELGMDAVFVAVYTPEQGIAGKPAPDLLWKAAEAMWVPVSRCLVFEDSVSGFKAAEAAGAPFVAITQGVNPGCLDHAEGAVARHADFTGLTVEKLAGYVNTGGTAPPAG
ncbi:MAG: HAD family hydrolase [Candidatus Hydrogenedentota bacterium]